MKTILCIILLFLLTISKLAANDAFNECGETVEEHNETALKGEYCLNPRDENCKGSALSTYNFITKKFRVQCMQMNEETFNELYERLDK